jgi:hypothetical protein
MTLLAALALVAVRVRGRTSVEGIRDSVARSLRHAAGREALHYAPKAPFCAHIYQLLNDRESRGLSLRSRRGQKRRGEFSLAVGRETMIRDRLGTND